MYHQSFLCRVVLPKPLLFHKLLGTPGRFYRLMAIPSSILSSPLIVPVGSLDAAAVVFASAVAAPQRPQCTQFIIHNSVIIANVVLLMVDGNTPLPHPSQPLRQKHLQQ